MINARLVRTSYLFDALNRRTVTIDGLSNRSTTIFDAAGNVGGVLNARGVETQYSYDAANRLGATIEASNIHDLGTAEAAVGLVKPRAGDAKTMQELVDGYITARTDLKPLTHMNLDQARKKLFAFFSPQKPIRDITEGDAEEYWRFLRGREGLANNTARRLAGRAKQFFRYAARKRWIPTNPFTELKTSVMGNPERNYFVTREDAQKVLDACLDAEWRLIFALCRYGGLWCPSEVLALRWRDINWEQSRFTVRSPKTVHHEGKASRIVPIFPELYPHLRDAFESVMPGAEYVVHRSRDSGINLRTRFGRIIERAGLVPWPKLFDNLRASRQTELAENYPMHVVCMWIGNSEAIARDHYLQVTDEHYALAATTEREDAAQNPAQSVAESGCQRMSRATGGRPQRHECQELAIAGMSVQKNQLPPRGLEPLS